jgi:hypothetical protein
LHPSIQLPLTLKTGTGTSIERQKQFNAGFRAGDIR